MGIGRRRVLCLGGAATVAGITGVAIPDEMVWVSGSGTMRGIDLESGTVRWQTAREQANLLAAGGGRLYLDGVDGVDVLA